MSGLLTRAEYEPIAVECMEAAKKEAAKLPPGTVIAADYKLPDGSAKELVNWQKREGFSFPVIAIVNDLNGLDLLEVMRDGGAVDVIQRHPSGNCRRPDPPQSESGKRPLHQNLH